jgi:tetratricopeptide (TPR) repeat protein
VVKMNPPYDVEFNARINIAGVFDINSGNTRDIRKDLEKMLKDAKNKEFLDQIYFAMGNLSMREGNENEALDFFRKSASESTVNRNQKGRSYLALADYYFKVNDFLNAGKYYDSTVYFLDETHPDYKQLQSRSQNLNVIVSQLRIIQNEDSLQKVASMSEAERNALISSIISEVTKAKSEGKTSDYSDRYNMGQYYENERRFQDNIDKEGKWYFYNQSALTFGRTEFKRRWGDRKLEDNWRRANKTRVSASQISANGEEPGQKTTDSSNAVLDYKKPEFYLKNLPLTDSLMAASNDRIADAYLNAGKAYSEKIGDPVRATESFEQLISRYPGNELVPEALYSLYRTNRDVNSSTAETYRQRLLEKYPSTEFARILSDPGYYEKKLAGMKMAEQLYQQAYNTYTAENFNGAIVMCDEALKTYGEDQLAPKFMLLHAYCVARISDERAFKEELNKVVKQWPQTQEASKATDIIAYLNQQLPELKIEEDIEIAKELFVADTAKTNIFALIISDPSFNINQATFDVISYNIDNYTNKNYRTEGTLVDNKYIMITVSGFANCTTVLEYFNSFRIEKIVRNLKVAQMFSFVISNDNLNVLNKDKNPERYRLFFMENYLNEKNKDTLDR